MHRRPLPTEGQAQAIWWPAAGLALLLLGACSDDSAPARPLPRPPVFSESLTPSDSLADETLAPCCDPEARQVVVRNGGQAPIQLDVTCGPASFVGIVDERGHFGRLRLDQGTDLCGCACNPSARCEEREAPRPRWVTVAPGETHRLPWNGNILRLKHDRDEEDCYERAGPPAGRYLVRVCARDDGGCATARVQVPSTDPIELTLAGNPSRVEACPTEALVIERAARLALYRMRLNRTAVDRLQRCQPARAVCAPTGGEAPPDASACAIQVVPWGQELEARVLLPPLGGRGAGDRFSVFFDPDAVTVQRVRFTP